MRVGVEGVVGFGATKEDVINHVKLSVFTEIVSKGLGLSIEKVTELYEMINMKELLQRTKQRFSSFFYGIIWI